MCICVQGEMVAPIKQGVGRDHLLQINLTDQISWLFCGAGLAVMYGLGGMGF